MTRMEPWFDVIVERHRPMILAYCLRRADPPDAHDATADVFAVAWRRRDDLPRGDETLAWLYGVARRVLAGQRRGAGRFHRLAQRAAERRPVPPPGPEEVVVQSAEHEQVRRALGHLKPADREVLRLAAWEGLNHAQIAQVLDCSTEAVHKRVSRAKVRLARAFTTLEPVTARVPPASARGGEGS